MSIPMPTAHGEFSSADASSLDATTSQVALYGPGGTTALTLNSNDYVHVSQLSISSAGTNLTVSVYDGADATIGAGELIWKGVVATNTTANVHLPHPHVCQKGTPPRVKTSGAGQVDVTLHGAIARVGV